MKKIILANALFLALPAFALETMDDQSLATVSGQAGLTIELKEEGVTVDALTYTEDGQSISIEDIAITPVQGQSTYDSATTLDILGDGTLAVDVSAEPRDSSIGNIRMQGSDKSFGSLYARYDIDSKLRLKGLPLNAGFDLSGSELNLNYDRVLYRDNGLDWIIDDLVVNYKVMNGQISIDNNQLIMKLGDNANRGANLELGFGAMGLNATNVNGLPSSLLGGSLNANEVFGTFYLNLDTYGEVRLEAGGKSGEGFTFIPKLTLINDDPNNAAFQYTDDGFLLSASSFTGVYSTTSGFTIDLESDAEGPYVDVSYADYDFEFHLGDVVLGGTDPTANTIASIGGAFHFQDDVANSRFNQLKIRPGGDTLTTVVDKKGITTDISWNLHSDSPRTHDNGTPGDASDDYKQPGLINTHLAIADNGRYVLFNGFRSHGEGRITLDMTSRSSAVSGVGYVGTKSLYTSDYDGHFDGLRIGLHDIKGSYSFDGVTVGRSEAEALNAPLMGGTELLLSMEVFPAYDFTVNGHVTLKPGTPTPTATDNQGITINSDLFITDANAALTVDENSRGVWLTGVNYETHFRDASVNITEDGLSLNKGTFWSTIDIADIKFGDKENGASLGAFRLERLEEGSSISIASGGAGAVCLGGVGAAATACTNSGGRFEDRGDEGLTVKLNSIFVEDDGSAKYQGKNNRFAWTQANGTTLSLEKFGTNDGNPADPSKNEYGFNLDLSVDVYETKVSGVSPDPLGFAVQGRIHFKQFEIEQLRLSGPVGGLSAAPQTLVHGVVIQNADIIANLTATPIQ